MRSLIFGRNRANSDPAPSRWSWRLQRLLLTPAFLVFLRIGIPVFAIAASVAWYFSDPARIQSIRDKVTETRASFESRPEFMVHLMAIDGAGDDLAEEIRSVLPLIFPVSSFDLNLVDIRDQVMALDPVKSAVVRIKPGGVLQVEVQPRIPVVVWRTRDGLSLLDEAGVFVRSLPTRSARMDLPVVAGDGANLHIPEALALFVAAEPLGARVVGLERMGERRWDVVLDRAQRLLLPEEHAVDALDRVIALDAAQGILSRDIRRVDLRLGRRPTVQMSAFATGEWWAIRQAEQ